MTERIVATNTGGAKMVDDVGGTRGQKIRIEQHSAVGMLWCAAWLFTIGFLHLHFWKAVLAIVVWPYYLGAHLAPPLS